MTEREIDEFLQISYMIIWVVCLIAACTSAICFASGSYVGGFLGTVLFGGVAIVVRRELKKFGSGTR